MTSPNPSPSPYEPPSAHDAAGILSSPWILEQGFLFAPHKSADGSRLVQPASLDLCATDFYEMPHTCVPHGEPMQSLITRKRGRPAHMTTHGALLLPGRVYIGRYVGDLPLPPDVFAIANPKSSLGRVDVHVRVLTDTGATYDRIPAGYRGPLWIEVVPRSFPVCLNSETPIAQLRFVRRALVDVDAAELAAAHGRSPVVRYTPVDSAMDATVRTDHNDLILTASTRGAKREIVGFRARKHAPLLDLGRVGDEDPTLFWTPLFSSDELILEPGEFYLLRSRELLSVPPDMVAEMVPFDAGAGEFRAHYAGFFDNGFGHGSPSAAVLEVRNHHAVPMRLEHGQPFCRLRFLRFACAPERAYGAEGMGSHYQGQRLALSKHFAPFPKL